MYENMSKDDQIKELQAEVERLREELSAQKVITESYMSERDRYKELADERLETLADVEQERDQLKAQVNALTSAISTSGVYKTSEELCDLMHSTHAHCLAAHDAEVIEQAAIHACSVTDEDDLAVNFHSALMNYANQLRQQAKEV